MDTDNVHPTQSLVELRQRLADRLAALAAGLLRGEEALREFSTRLDHLRSRHPGLHG
jgi:hypothetical protein